MEGFNRASMYINNTLVTLEDQYLIVIVVF